jgi:DNA-binding transcriptional ArsR family regulator
VRDFVQRKMEIVLEQRLHSSQHEISPGGCVQHEREVLWDQVLRDGVAEVGLVAYVPVQRWCFHAEAAGQREPVEAGLVKRRAGLADDLYADDGHRPSRSSAGLWSEPHAVPTYCGRGRREWFLEPRGLSALTERLASSGVIVPRGAGSRRPLRVASLRAILSLMDKYSAALDGVFVALADPTRRAVVGRLGVGPASVGELAQAFPMALPSFMKHVRTLEAQGLIRTRKSGRVRTCVLERQRLDLVDGWLAQQRSIWEGRTDRLEQFVVDPREEQL